MASRNKTTLKTYFNTGDFPTETHFHDLIDSNLNLSDSSTQTVSSPVTISGEFNASTATNYLGLHKFQGFVGTLAGCAGNSTQYSDNEILVELGTLNTTVPSGFVAATQFFFTEIIINKTAAMGSALTGNLAVGSVSGEATNTALTNDTEIMGIDATDPISGMDSATQNAEGANIDIDFNATGIHYYTPNTSAVIARKYLYARTTTTYAASNVDGRFTVAAKYIVF